LIRERRAHTTILRRGKQTSNDLAKSVAYWQGFQIQVMPPSWG
jgi:hypothetical protein